VRPVGASAAADDEPADPAAAVSEPQAPVAAAEPAPPLAKRVRGAQLPDTGRFLAAADDAAPRQPDQVRSSLAAFQGGVALGRDMGASLAAPAAPATPAATLEPDTDPESRDPEGSAS
jgi:hypothetical protein